MTHAAPGRLPATVVTLGIVSMLMDLSSEMIHSLLPLFLVASLGASALSVGLISGLAEGAVAFTKLFSGAFSDWVGRRKPLLLAGYGLAAACKPLFPLAHAVSTVFAAHVLDRIAKGIRGAPRDALIADVTLTGQRGAAYGLRQSLDTVGAILGPALALVLMASLDSYRLVFAVAVVPAVLAVLAIVLFVREPPRPARMAKPRLPLEWGAFTGLGAGFWWLVAIMAGVMLTRFSEAFLLLRGHDTGLAAEHTPLVLIVMNLAYSASAYPLGILADRWPRVRLLAAGVLCLSLSQAVLALAAGPALALAGAALWGLHQGVTQGLFAAMIADSCPAERRGTAFGVFGMTTGVAAVAGGALAGGLWDLHGGAATYGIGAALSALTLLVFAFRPRAKSPDAPHA